MTQILYKGKKEMLGEMLVSSGKLERLELERALSHQSEVTSRIGEILVTLGFVSEDVLINTLAEQLELSIYQASAEDEFVRPMASDDFLRAHPFLLIRRAGAMLLVSGNPLDGDLVQAADLVCGEPWQMQLATESEVKRLVDEHYGITNFLADINLAVDESDIDRLKDMASEAPVIKYVNSLIDTAVQRRASDIHLEPDGEGLLVRLRIDGILHELERPPHSMQAAIVSRTKLLAALDIAERRLPQDGKISMRISGKEIDLRVATMPTVHGEGVVIRILEKGSIIFDLAELGMPESFRHDFDKLVRQPDGIVLVTGPTGSGKTTSLYCALHQISDVSNKIITIEDPVEYQLKGINQIQVKPDIDLTFAKGLRSIVRQDPDVIMVGEIRDLETAEIAVQSSLTGHLVLSTLHTNDSISAVTRLVDLGVERFLLVSSLRGIMAQRLVRRICRHCKEDAGTVAVATGEVPAGGDFPIYEGRGCPACSGSGYSGRIGVFELLLIDDVIARGISRGLDLADLRDLAVKNGFKSMADDGMAKVRAGETTLTEVVRVIRER